MSLRGHVDRYHFPFRFRPDPVRIFAVALLIATYFFHASVRLRKVMLTGYRASLSTLSGMQAFSVPKDAETFIRDYRLTPQTTTYVLCPRCFSLHPDSAPARIDGLLPKCPARSTSASPPCDANLFADNAHPHLRYDHRSFKDWLARFMSLPGMEELLEKYKGSQEQAIMDDIWQSPFWWRFKDTDGKSSFFHHSHLGELRLLFGLGMDGFNPFQALESKQVRDLVTSALCTHCPLG